MRHATLYKLCIRVIADSPIFRWLDDDIGPISEILTPEMHFSVMYQMYEGARDCPHGQKDLNPADSLMRKLSDVRTFVRLLNVGHRRQQLHEVVSGLVNINKKRESEGFLGELTLGATEGMEKGRLKGSDGLQIGGFLAEAGWYEMAGRVLTAALASVRKSGDQPAITESLTLLINVLAHNCQFQMAQKLVEELEVRIETRRPGPSQYAALANFCYQKSDFDAAFKFYTLAVSQLSENLPPKVIVDVLRTASRTYVMKRQYSKAAIMIQTAVVMSMEIWTDSHPKTADALIDYGFYLMNIDEIEKSQKVYMKACDIRERNLGERNLLTALIHEDVAYSTYVYEYNYGYFIDAKKHALKAINIMNALLPEDHLSIASGKRVLALILEEMAIDLRDKIASNHILRQAEALHLSALDLCITNLGEMNIQSAKHYGNLGRLYQSMQMPDKAEAMHLKAISIKEALLGGDDYEVSLSLGHLASLYNFDMGLYDKAEPLYMRIIGIGVRLFGEAYSGLEYEYRGLIRLYQAKGNMEKAVYYRMKLEDWKDLRQQGQMQQPISSLPPEMSPEPLKNITDAVVNNKPGISRKDDGWMFSYLQIY